MNAHYVCRVVSSPFARESSRTNAKNGTRKKTHDNDGFTLVELLVTLTILPLVIGALSLGLIAIFSLNNQTSSRLTDTADAQVVASTYQKDVQSAGYITTDSDSSPQCGAGTGTQLLALESVPNQTTGDFQTVVSYVAVPTSVADTSYSLVRLYCTNGSVAPASQSTLAFDLPSPTVPAPGSTYKPLTPPSITCSSGASPDVCSASGQQWTQGYVPAQDIGTVSFDVTEPSSTFNYVLAASPAASTSFNSGGVASTKAAVCEQTLVNTGPNGGQLCLIDFSGLTQNDLAVAETPGQCFKISVDVGVSDVLNFCLAISSNDPNEGVVATPLPSDTNAGLGNTVYQGLGGEPALYMNPYISEGTTLKMSLSGFSLVNASTGQKVTSWTFMSADAETTNSQESITWTSNVPISVVNDAEAGAPSPDGNACPMTGNGTNTVTCKGTLNSENAPLTGAAMVSMLGTNLSSVIVNTNNYEAVAFGMFTP